MAKKNPDELSRIWHGGELTIVGNAVGYVAGTWVETIGEQVIDYGDRRVKVHAIDLDMSAYRLLTPGGTPQLEDSLEIDWEFSTQARGGQIYRMLSVGRHKINSGYSGDPGGVPVDYMRSAPDLYIVRQKIDFGGEGKVLDLDYDEFIYHILNYKLDSAVAINWFVTWRTISWFEQVGEWGQR